MNDVRLSLSTFEVRGLERETDDNRGQEDRGWFHPHYSPPNKNLRLKGKNAYRVLRRQIFKNWPYENQQKRANLFWHFALSGMGGMPNRICHLLPVTSQPNNQTTHHWRAAPTDPSRSKLGKETVTVWKTLPWVLASRPTPLEKHQLTYGSASPSSWLLFSWSAMSGETELDF